MNFGLALVQVLLRGSRKAREAVKHFGPAPGCPAQPSPSLIHDFRILYLNGNPSLVSSVAVEFTITCSIRLRCYPSQLARPSKLLPAIRNYFLTSPTTTNGITVIIYIFAPTLAFCNAFGCGLTGFQDWLHDLSFPTFDLCEPSDWTEMGCVISPCVFLIFYKAFPDIGYPTSEYPGPFATVYYTMARLGVEGFSPLPKHCLKLCCVFFAAAILINLIRDILGKKRSWFIPLPMAMGMPFFLGSYFGIDMCVGSLILYIWQKVKQGQGRCIWTSRCLRFNMWRWNVNVAQLYTGASRGQTSHLHEVHLKSNKQ
ncbi:putative metal-nicotianamine transporter YSL7 [Sesamum angolense]|uniref:Metal-nicotianamine transporter YSL7 n=1 Tax=Sesamum angolense TaxID=2727404 RepID=A0AAE1WKL5_9LAMI|nr:putative metal-nicotianamine transporter YSL7 [Sesamum angolense]